MYHKLSQLAAQSGGDCTCMPAGSSTSTPAGPSHTCFTPIIVQATLPAIKKSQPLI